MWNNMQFRPPLANDNHILVLVFLWYRRILIGAGVVFLLLSAAALWPEAEEPTLRAAIRNVDVLGVERAVEKWQASRGPGAVDRLPVVYYLSEMAEDSSKEAAQILTLLASNNWLGHLNDHVTPRYHALTCAYRQRRFNVARLLLETAAKDGVLIPEVYASYLDCNDIHHLDAKTVTLVTFMGERRDCVLQYPRRVPFASSRLYQDLDTHGLLRNHFDTEPQRLPPVRSGPRRVPRGKLPSGSWDSPFFPPPVGILPPPNDLVMNPGCFEDLVEAASYYFAGSLMQRSMGGEALKLIMWVTFVCSVSAVMAAVWSDIVSPLIQRLQSIHSQPVE